MVNLQHIGCVKLIKVFESKANCCLGFLWICFDASFIAQKTMKIGLLLQINTNHQIYSAKRSIRVLNKVKPVI